MSKATSKPPRSGGSFQVVKSLKSGTSGGTVQKKMVIGPDGRFVGIQTIDARSKTFGYDLAEVFTKNVARHRRANTKVADKKA